MSALALALNLSLTISGAVGPRPCVCNEAGTARPRPALGPAGACALNPDAPRLRPSHCRCPDLTLIL